MVIDDDPVSRFIAGDAIEEAALAQHIIYCNNGKEAISYLEENCFPTLEKLNRQCPGLILLDINMEVWMAMNF